MDGYQFQKFVANLFKKLGFMNIKVGPPTADGGVDISMEQGTDIGNVKFTIECKHHPESIIGRPVVQKLHSAVIHSPFLNKGIIVTSGHFSSEAIQYAEEVGIELIDKEKLEELAGKAGMTLQTESSSLIENCFPISKKLQVIEKLNKFLLIDLNGFNQNYVRIEEIGLKLLSSYMVDYCIDATFSTSVGIIHSIRDKSSIFFTGDNGEPITAIITDPLLPFQPYISNLNKEDLREFKLLEKRKFIKSHKEIKESARETLRRRYTQTVSYYGANNRRYKKTCVPQTKDITLLEIKRVFCPLLVMIFSISKKKYIVMGIDIPAEFIVLPSNFITIQEPSGIKTYPDGCMICSRDMGHSKYVCSECGSIVCHKDVFKCKTCGKVICREHTISKRKFLVLSDKYCLQCAESKAIVS